MEVQIHKIIKRFNLHLRCTFAFLAVISSANAQHVIKEADAQFLLSNFHKAAELYEQAYRKKTTLHSAEGAAESYAAQNNFRQAESWYAIAAAMEGSTAKDVLGYAKALQNNGKYTEAKAQYNKYSTLDNNISTAQKNLWLASCDSAVVWMRNPTNTTLINEKSLNTPQSDWAAVKQLGNIVFVSDRELMGEDPQQKARPFLKFDGAKKPSRTVYGRTGNSYLRIYEKQNGSDSITFFPLDAASEYHVGPASFTADGNTMYFARSQSLKNLKRDTKGKFDSLAVAIYMTTKNADGKWNLPTPFKYNATENHSVGDPFISADGKTLYFSSNRPGGMGGMDLYVCNKTDGGEWSEPINLKALNSAGNDRSLSVGNDGVFYFSSDGRIGMGGLDVFKSVQNGDQFGTPINMHYPINSPQDDFAFNLYSNADGYLSSNRTDGVGSDDIYRFAMKKMVAFNLAGKVFDKKTNELLANAIVTLKKVDGETLKLQTDETGDFKFKLEAESDYKLSAEKTDYRGDNASLTTKGLKDSSNLKQNLYLEQIAINKSIKLENIYYDFDKSNIRPDAATELDKLVAIMQDNPTIWIELGSYTDSRGSDSYNLKLSQRRANAAVQYIISRGIDKNRIEAKGYGETQPVNGCVNGVKCSEADYQLNRRTEFKITKQ